MSKYRLFPTGLLCVALRWDSAFALDDAFARSARTQPRRVLHRRLDVAPHEGTIHIALAPELDVAHGLTLAFQHPIRIGQRTPARESQVDMPRVGRNVTEHVLHLSAEPEPNGNRVHLVDRLRGIGRFLKNHLSQRESEIRDVPVVGFKESEQLGIRGTLHGSGQIYTESYEPEVGPKPFYSLVPWILSFVRAPAPYTHVDPSVSRRGTCYRGIWTKPLALAADAGG
jgi:hypothetical protein